MTVFNMLWIPLALIIILLTASYQDYKDYRVHPLTWLPALFIIPYSLTLWPPGVIQLSCLAFFSTCFIIPRARQYLGGADLIALVLISALYPNPRYLLFLVISGILLYGWSLTTKKEYIPALVPITVGFIVSLLV